MNSCSNISLISAYHDDELDASRRAEVEGHLSACPQCAAELEQLKSLSLLIAARPKLPGLSNEANRRMHRHVEELTDRSVLRFAELLSGIAAAVILVATIWSAQPAKVAAEPVVAWDRAAVMLEPEQPSSSPAQIRTVAWMVSELSTESSPGTRPAIRENGASQR